MLRLHEEACMDPTRDIPGCIRYTVEPYHGRPRYTCHTFYFEHPCFPGDLWDISHLLHECEMVHSGMDSCLRHLFAHVEAQWKQTMWDKWRARWQQRHRARGERTERQRLWDAQFMG